MNEIEEFLPVIRSLHDRIREAVVAACEASSLEALSNIAKEEKGDTIYAIDVVSEKLVVECFEQTAEPLVLIAEGIENGKLVLPRGTAEADAKWRVIVDPIDGTRGLMFQKRSAWILTGVAANRGSRGDLADIELAVQTEIPLVKQHLSDTVWALRGRGAAAERFNRLTGESVPLSIAPAKTPTISHGFASISRFVPGVSSVGSEIYEEVVAAALGDVQPGKAPCFEDQYICTGGQLFGLMSGQDRFVADLRPLTAEGSRLGLCCHPYDLSTEMIARELGVIITDAAGLQLTAPLELEPNVAWVGYANAGVRAEIEPLLRTALKKRGLI